MDKPTPREHERVSGAPLVPTQEHPTMTGRVVPVETLARMFQSEDTDMHQWGHYWRKGWNDALRQAMDYAR
jgi:hypothetical protein